LTYLKKSIPAKQFSPAFLNPQDRPPAPENKFIKLYVINSYILYYFYISKKIISCKKKGPKSVGPF